MRCRLDLKSFRKAFGKAGRASSPRSPKVVLQSVLMDASDPHDVTLTATDLDVAARVPLTGAVIDAPGRVLLPREVIDRILSATSGEAIELDSEGPKLSVRCGSGRWALNTQDCDLFPDPFAQSAGPSFAVDAAALALAIRRTIYACEKEGGSSYALAGISLEWAGGRMSAVASDGCRISHQECDCEVIAAPEEGRTHVIPQKLAGGLLLPALEDEPGTVEVSFPAGTLASFRFSGHAILGRMLEGRFPAWRQYLPESASHRPRLDLASLRDAIGQASATVSETSKGVDLEFSDGQLAVSSPESEAGSGRCEVAIDHAGPPITLAVRPEFLIAALKSLDVAEVELLLFGPKDPLGIACDGFRHYAMPLTRER